MVEDDPFSAGRFVVLFLTGLKIIGSF